ncbi:hypothetical protein ACSSS7_005834 [Eimeria intestinalis]
MAKLTRTSQLSCLAWLLVLFLQLQQSQHVAASAGNEDDDSPNMEALPEQDAEVQEDQVNVDVPAVVEEESSPAQPFSTQDGRQAVVDEDEGLRPGHVQTGSDRGRLFRRVAVRVGLTGVLLALALAAYVSMVEAHFKFSASITNLRKLEALLPTAQRLFIAVDTRESARLWFAIKDLLPELSKTLSTAKAKSQDRRFFVAGLLTGEYADHLKRVDETAEKISRAIAALHKNAREELKVIAARTTEIPSSQLQRVKDQLQKVLGFGIAVPYVDFVGMQESRGYGIVRTIRTVVERSEKSPVFEGGMDEALLQITLKDVDFLKRMFVARDDALTRMANAQLSCTRVFASTLRAKITAAEQQYRTLVTGLSFFLQQLELPSDIKQLLTADFEKVMAILNEAFPPLLGSISENVSINDLSAISTDFEGILASLTELTALPERQVLPEGQGDQRTQLRANLATLMKGAAEHAELILNQVQILANDIRGKVEASKDSFFPSTLKGMYGLAEKYSGTAEEAAESCRKLADQLESDQEVQSLFDTFMQGVEESKKVFSERQSLLALQGGFELLEKYEADVRASLALIDALEVDSAVVEGKSARKLVSLKDEATTIQALAGNAPYLHKASMAANEIRRAAELAVVEHHNLAVLKLETEHRKGNRSAWMSANE